MFKVTSQVRDILMMIEWHGKLTDFVKRSANGNEMLQRVSE